MAPPMTERASTCEGGAVQSTAGIQRNDLVVSGDRLISVSPELDYIWRFDLSSQK